MSSIPSHFPDLPAGWTTETRVFHSGPKRLYLAVHRSPDLQPGAPMKRAVFVIHGQGEHFGRYRHFPHYLQAGVDAVVGIDLTGHGRSEGPRGHIDRIDDYCDDVLAGFHYVTDWFRTAKSECEMHLVGHSMGGLIALRFLLVHDHVEWASATISAPLLGLRVRVPPAKKLLAQIINPFLGNLQMNNEVDATLLSHDPDLVKTYQNDRLVHSKVTPRFFLDLQKAMPDTISRWSLLDPAHRTPVLFLIPEADQVVDPEVAKRCYELMKARKKKLKLFPGFFHEGFNEVKKEQLFEELLAWIQAHSKLPAKS